MTERDVFWSSSCHAPLELAGELLEGFWDKRTPSSF